MDVNMFLKTKYQQSCYNIYPVRLDITNIPLEL